MNSSGAWPPSRPNNDLGPVSVPEDASLPLRVTGHVQPESSNDGGYSPFSVKNCRVITATKPGTDLVKAQTSVPSSQPTHDVAGASDIELALNRAQLSLGDTRDRSDDTSYISDAHHVGVNLRPRHNRMVLDNDRSIPKRLLLIQIRVSGRQNRWRERFAARRARREQARLHLNGVPLHLSDGSVLPDRKGGAGSHSSGLPLQPLSASDLNDLQDPAAMPLGFVEIVHAGGELASTAGPKLDDLQPAVGGDVPDLPTTLSDDDVPTGGV